MSLLGTILAGLGPNAFGTSTTHTTASTAGNTAGNISTSAVSAVSAGEGTSGASSGGTSSHGNAGGNASSGGTAAGSSASGLGAAAGTAAGSASGGAPGEAVDGAPPTPITAPATRHAFTTQEAEAGQEAKPEQHQWRMAAVMAAITGPRGAEIIEAASRPGPVQPGSLLEAVKALRPLPKVPDSTRTV